MLISTIWSNQKWEHKRYWIEKLKGENLWPACWMLTQQQPQLFSMVLSKERKCIHWPPTSHRTFLFEASRWLRCRSRTLLEVSRLLAGLLGDVRWELAEWLSYSICKLTGLRTWSAPQLQSEGDLPAGPKWKMRYVCLDINEMSGTYQKLKGHSLSLTKIWDGSDL